MLVNRWSLLFALTRNSMLIRIPRQMSGLELFSPTPYFLMCMHWGTILKRLRHEATTAAYWNIFLYFFVVNARK